MMATHLLTHSRHLVTQRSIMGHNLKTALIWHLKQKPHVIFKQIQCTSNIIGGVQCSEHFFEQEYLVHFLGYAIILLLLTIVLLHNEKVIILVSDWLPTIIYKSADAQSWCEASHNTNTRSLIRLLANYLGLL